MDLDTVLPQLRVASDPQLSPDVSEELRPVVVPFMHDLVVVYAGDLGDTFGLVQHVEAALQGLDVEALHDQAMQHFLDRFGEQLHMQELADGCYALLVDGNHESSLLLLDGLWDEVLADVASGDLLVAAPALDVLAFGSAEDPAAVTRLTEIVQGVWDDPEQRHLTRTLFCRTNGTWQAVATHEQDR